MATTPHPAPAPELSTRTLNRATLARQLLLRRADMDAAEAVEHLVGLQTQVPGNHYTALWSRLAGFDAEDFSRRFAEREFVRLSMMRCTLHTVTARDALALRPLVQAPQDRSLKSSFGGRLAGVDPEAVAVRSRELLEERPLGTGELGELLAAEWPDTPPRALGMVARHLLPLVQVPPRGLWRTGGAARHTTAEHWLGAPLAGSGDSRVRPDPDAFVLRYLAAFGPASVRDAQTWSGLTRLREVVERHRPELAVFRDGSGTELYDLPDAPRPDADVPAPPRFLPEFDNVFIGHKDRSRVVARDDLRLFWTGYAAKPVFLSDGFLRGTWRIDTDAGTATGRERAVLALKPFAPLPRAGRDELAAEGTALLAFHAPGADHDVRWEPPYADG
ncbi:winged helix DNA-binding domain-containing protein [Streptomyces sp. Z26]|uniref:winged helix DNA-binding domain-containing protein n=1 Tax=Streptomyces sp. Z26 TaxID=2500177 RepID=UPI000EF13226|nr:winged helix DNA-binding domain-containing protein [Streptomyces sp. Z26]RLL69481.1 winged helix DNA-binding domain-containing protein [Streptomyces sp. Z26]